MSTISTAAKGDKVLMMGNDAIARGALEAGVKVVAAYPGTPSSEIPAVLGEVADERGLYVEWSANEKVSLEVAAAASFAGLRALCTMKQVGVNVAADFLLHVAEFGVRAGLVVVSCEDPGALSSTNEGDSRHYAKMMELPLIEPSGIQEALEMTRWAFDLSERVNNVVMLRSTTRLSHASGSVAVGELPVTAPRARFDFTGTIREVMTGPFITLPPMVETLRTRQQESLAKTAAAFDSSPFNTFTGPQRPEVTIITSSSATSYCMEALSMLGLEERVGVVKLATTWPLPAKFLERHLANATKVFVVEEGTPFLEDNVKAFYGERAAKLPAIEFFGRKGGTMHPTNELNPDLVASGLRKILGVDYQPVDPAYAARAAEIMKNVPSRGLTFCPGCPHRATFWLLKEALALDGTDGFICGDIGCYSMAATQAGFSTVKTLAAMGSGVSMASGFGKLGRFGFDQTVLAVCGDSTFFHAVMPGLVNAVHNKSDILLVILDNSGTAMTGFQPHPGIPEGADGHPLPALDIPRICEAFGAKVAVADCFDFEESRRVLGELMEDPSGVRVLVMRQPCALSPQRKGKKAFKVSVDREACLGDACGCNRLCTRVFKCPGLIWDPAAKKTSIDEFVCAGCGVCAQVCPQKAIRLERAG